MFEYQINIYINLLSQNITILEMSNGLEKVSYDLGTNPDNMKSIWENIGALSPLRAWMSFRNPFTIPFVPTQLQFEEYVNESARSTRDFQSGAQDPAIEIPSGVKKIDMWYQKTLADNLVESPDEEWMINLWGLKDNAIHNNSGVPIELGKNLFDLTTGTNVKHNLKQAIGHNEVPDVYEERVVETGKLNHDSYSNFQ